MTQQNKSHQVPPKITVIPLKVQSSSAFGILNFPSQKYGTTFQKPNISLKNHQQQITFKSMVGKASDSQDDEDEFARKKIINSNRVTIKPENIKKRYFRVDIPIQKGPPVGVKNNREKINFVIQFNQENQGTLTVIDDVFDSQVEITNEQTQYTMQERIKIQEMKMDARRREQKVQIDEKKDGRKKQK